MVVGWEGTGVSAGEDFGETVIGAGLVVAAGVGEAAGCSTGGLLLFSRGDSVVVGGGVTFSSMVFDGVCSG